MRPRAILQIMGVINMIIAAAMLAPLCVSLLFDEGDTKTFVISVAITAAVGLVLYFVFRTKDIEISHREGFVVVAASWLCASFFSALPFYISGTLPSLTDAVFEASSGITTTGASVLNQIEGLPHGILFWRSMTHWLGGIGIVLFSVAILPLLGIGGMQLYKAEASSITGDKFVPRIKDMAKILVKVYLFLSFVMMVLLLISGMGLFDAFVHAVGSISTGGFSDKNMSIAYYNNALIEWLIIIFMFVGATSFNLHYDFYKKGVRSYLKSEEFRFFFFTLLASTVLIAINLKITGYVSSGSLIRDSAFQVVSISTTTGYTTANYAQWPAFSQLILLLLMFIGGCAGSTTGAIKSVRVLVLFKFIYKELYRLIHPHAVAPVKLNGRVLSPEIVKGITGFTIIYFLVFIVSTLLLTTTNLDLVTSISSVATCLGGIGPALGATGPMSNFAALHGFAKWILILDMILGRLEIYTLLILFIPAFWRG
ncbi:Trk potassium uptake system protein TrkH [hydrothermal vent metagenome]|uniref:Trk potassium uptake system protein TrkH n=1 Tax=hydrothermal vent metagenome TaxID=652676 RepID=A0A3B0V9D2_9ZZZZ